MENKINKSLLLAIVLKSFLLLLRLFVWRSKRPQGNVCSSFENGTELYIDGIELSPELCRLFWNFCAFEGPYSSPQS